MHTEFRTASGVIGPDTWAGYTGILPAAWLHRPYLNLSPVEDLTAHPIHALGPQAAFAALTGDDPTPAPNQSHASAQLRVAVAQETGLRWFDIGSPAELPVSLRTARWDLLVELVDRFAELGLTEQAAVITLLDRLGLHHAISALVPAQPDDLVTAVRAAAALALRRAHSRRLTGLGDRAEDIRLLELVALRGPDPQVSLAAAITLVVAHARSRDRDINQVEKWADVADSWFTELETGDHYPDNYYRSMYWRAVSYVPFLHGEFRDTEGMLDEAMRCVEEPDSTATPGHRITWLQNQHPLLETRTKAALAAGDLDGALLWAKALTELDPLDAKVHIELGDVHSTRDEQGRALAAYRRAASLGAPYRAFATYLVGRCRSMLGRSDAVSTWAETVRADPLSFSARQSLASLSADDHVSGWLTGWATTSLESLRRRLSAMDGRAR